MSERKPKLTPRQMRAAEHAVTMFLMDDLRDWPEGVTRRDMEGAAEKLRAMFARVAVRELAKLTQLTMEDD